jgi:hypothetical protein
MGSTLAVQDCVFLRNRDNGVSSGQKSMVDMRGCLAAGSEVGVLVKSASTLRVTGSLLFGNEKAVRAEMREILYSGTVRLESDAVFAVENGAELDAPTDAAVDIMAIFRKFPADGALDHLLRNVLCLRSWDEFERWAASERLGLKYGRPQKVEDGD